MISSSQRRHLLGIGLLALAVFTALSLLPVTALGGASLFATGNIMGTLGRWFVAAAGALLGIGVIAVPLALALGGAACFDWVDHGRALRWSALLIGLAVLLPAFAALFAQDSGYELVALLPRGVAGWVGRTLALPFAALLGGFGALLGLTVLGIALFVATIGWNPFGAAVRSLRRFREVKTPSAAPPASTEVAVVDEEPVLAASTVMIEPEHAVVEESTSFVPALFAAAKGTASPFGLEDTGNPDSTDRPPLALLSEPPAQNTALSEAELDRLGDVLVQTLRTFKVESQIAGRTTGPVVTQYEVVPGARREGQPHRSTRCRSRARVACAQHPHRRTHSRQGRGWRRRAES